MSKKGTNKAGFRTFEMGSLEYQSQFFYRFLNRFPQAIEELKAMLPLFEAIFGKPRRISEHSETFKVRLFNSRYLLAPEELLLNYCNYQTNYPLTGNTRKRFLFPNFIQLPANHEYKCNETYYKGVIETSLLSDIAELRADGGDTCLYDVLKNQKEAVEDMERIAKENLRKFCVEKQIEADDFQISVEAKIQVSNILDEHKFYEIEYFDTLLANYWSFYQQFHAWLEKYYLRKHWLRHSFFIALCRGLKAVFPEIGTSIQLHQELQNELYGEETEIWHFQRNLPKPEPFIFDIISRSSDKLGHNTSQKKWHAESFSLFYTPPQYKTQEIEKFRQYLNSLELFELEGHILDAFSVFVDGSISMETRDNRQNLKNEFREYLWKFHVFKDLIEERNKILESFEEQIDNYLDTLLPVIKKYYPTNEGRPHNFEHIEWLLSWNVDKLTAKEIIDKFALKSEEPAIHKNFAKLKKYDLPVRTKKIRKDETPKNYLN